jgi:hypothetical protein
MNEKYQCTKSGYVRILIIFQNPDPFPGVYFYSNEHNKINRKGKFNKENLLCWFCWTY